MLFKEETVNPESTVQSDAQKVKNGLKQPPNIDTTPVLFTV